MLIQVCLPQSLFFEINKGIPWEKYQFTVNALSHISEDLILYEFYNLEREAIQLDKRIKMNSYDNISSMTLLFVYRIDNNPKLNVKCGVQTLYLKDQTLYLQFRFRFILTLAEC